MARKRWAARSSSARSLPEAKVRSLGYSIKRFWSDCFAAQNAPNTKPTSWLRLIFVEATQGSKMATVLSLSWGSSQFLPSSMNQVGREVEDFAECLDRLHPRRGHDPETVYENAFKLVRSYQTIAENAVKRL